MKNTNEPTLPEIQQIVKSCLDQLFKQDLDLLVHDVSERAITHKLAEYLQQRFPERNVDCEYNRNIEVGANAPKTIYFLQSQIQEMAKAGMPAEELLSRSTYPDIIVHRRTVNKDNLLVVEVKKHNSTQDHNFDHTKLKAFTEIEGENGYRYTFGVFIVLDTGTTNPTHPKLEWFINGKIVK